MARISDMKLPLDARGFWSDVTTRGESVAKHAEHSILGPLRLPLEPCSSCAARIKVHWLSSANSKIPWAVLLGQYGD